MRWPHESAITRRDEHLAHPQAVDLDRRRRQCRQLRARRRTPGSRCPVIRSVRAPLRTPARAQPSSAQGTGTGTGPALRSGPPPPPPQARAACAEPGQHRRAAGRLVRRIMTRDNRRAAARCPFTSGSSLLWYSTRATGIVALVLLTGTVMLGIVGTATGRLGALAAPGHRRPAQEPRPDLDRPRRRPCADHRPRPVRRDQPGRRVRAVQLAVPAALAEPGRGRLRPAARGHRHSPAPEPAEAPQLAAGAPARLRRLAGRAVARARYRY